MIAAWMLYATVVAAAVGLAALAAERALRLYRLPRRFVWLGTVAVSVLLPLIGLWRPPGGSPPNVAAEVMALEAWAVPGQVMATVGDGAAWDTVLLGLWLAASLLIAGWIVWTARRLRAERDGWRRATVDGVPLLVSRDLGPAIVGVMDPAIVVPAWLLQLPREERDMALLHEREHLAAGDTRLLVVGLAAVALMPWNAALWWQLARLRAAVEVDCDARVLGRGVAPSGYADLLLLVKRRGATAFAASPALMERQNLLTRRVREMVPRSFKGRRWRAAGYAAGAALVFALACEAPAPQMPSSVGPETGAPVPELAARFGAVPEDTPGLEAPEKISCPPPEYPRLLREAGIEGSVLLRFVINAEGAAIPGSIEVERSDHEAFEAAARATLPNCQFRPGTLDGAPARVMVSMPVAFRLGRRSAAPGAAAPDTGRVRLFVPRETLAAQRPLFVLDGEVLGRQPDFEALDIASIEVIRGEAAVRLYGESARRGVIVITTKGMTGR